MEPSSDQLMRVLIAVTIVDSALAAAIRLPNLARLVGGSWDFQAIVGGLGALWLIVLLSVLGRVIAHVRSIHSRLDSVLVTRGDWYWESDPHLIVTYSSTGVTELLGVAPENLVGRSLFELIPLEEADILRSALATAHATGAGWDSGTVRWRHADGSLVALTGTAVPIVSAEGQIVGFRGTGRRSEDHGKGSRYLDRLRDTTLQTIEAQTFDVALQPIVDLDTGRLRGVEALARFRDGRSPAEWFADAHATGCAIDLELATARAALDLRSAVPDEVYLSVNASPELLEDPRFEQLLNDVDHPEQIVIEVTEHAPITRYEAIVALLDRTRARGLRVAVDDIGAGYASFSHVLQLRPDIIKIDRSVVTRAPHDAAARALVSAIIRLAIEMDAHVTAEGIETALELHTLRVLDVQSAQGYLLARPSTDPADWQRWPDQRWSVRPPDRKNSASERTRTTRE